MASDGLGQRDVANHRHAAVDFAAIVFERPHADVGKHPVRLHRIADVQFDSIRGLSAHGPRQRQLVGWIKCRRSRAIDAKELAPLRARYFLGAGPDHLLGRGIEQHHLPVLVGHQNAVAHVVQNRPQDFRLPAVSRFRTRQRLLLLRYNFRRLLPLADFLGVSGGLQHRHFQIGRLPRLGNIGMDLAVVDGANQGIDVHISSDENPRRIADFAGFRQELAAGQLRHSLVGQNHGDLRVLKELHGFGGVGADHHLEIVFQQIVDRFQNLRLVIHDQHFRLKGPLRHAEAPSGTGIFRMNSVPFPGFAEEFHGAMMRLHDPVGNGKAETRCLLPPAWW